MKGCKGLGGAECKPKAEAERGRQAGKRTVDEVAEGAAGHELDDGDGIGCGSGAADDIDKEGGGGEGGEDGDLVGGGGIGGWELGSGEKTAIIESGEEDGAVAAAAQEGGRGEAGRGRLELLLGEEAEVPLGDRSAGEAGHSGRHVRGKES